MVEPSKPVALVTGGSRGIGRAIVRELHQKGFRVGFTFLKDEAAAITLVDELGCEDVISMKADAREISDCSEAAEAVIKAFGKLDTLVNNAGVTHDGPLYSMETSEWRYVLESNLSGTFNMCRTVVPLFLRRRQGAIVNVSSVAGLVGAKGQTNYCASKAGVIGLTRSLALECAPRGIRVNVVAPGFIRTDMTNAMDAMQKKGALDQIPMGHFGEPEDVARLTHFLLSENAAYITGQVFVVDGGLTS